MADDYVVGLSVEIEDSEAFERLKERVKIFGEKNNIKFNFDIDNLNSVMSKLKNVEDTVKTGLNSEMQRLNLNFKNMENIKVSTNLDGEQKIIANFNDEMGKTTKIATDLKNNLKIDETIDLKKIEDGFDKTQNKIKNTAIELHNLKEKFSSVFKGEELEYFKQKLNNIDVKNPNSSNEANTINKEINKFKVVLQERQKVANDEIRIRQQLDDAISKTVQNREKENKALQEGQAKASNNALDNNYKQILSFQQKQGQELNKISEKYKGLYSNIDMSKLKSQLDSLSPSSKTLEKDMQNVNKQVQDFKKGMEEASRVKSFGENIGKFGKIDLNSSIKDVEKFIKETVNANAKVKTLSEEMTRNGSKIKVATAEWKNADGTISRHKITLDQTTQSIYKSGGAFKEASSGASGFGNTLQNLHSHMLQYIGVSRLINEGINKIKEGFEVVKTLDKSQTNIKMITGMNDKEVGGFTNSLYKLSGQLHETLDRSMEAGEEFLRTGRSAEEAMHMIKSSTVMAAISGQEQKETSEQLVAISNAYGVSAEKSMGIVDKLTTVDNNAATSTRELADALSRTAASAKEADVPLEKIVSWIGTVSSTTRKSAESIGEGFKTIFSRMQDVKMGKDFDAYNEPLNNVERALNKNKIALRSSKGEFRNIGTVIEDVAKKWSHFDDVQKNQVASAIAGTRQRENFLVLMQHYQESLQLEEKQLKSNGNAMDRYKNYENSLEAKTKDVKREIQMLYRTMLQSEGLGNLASGFAKVIRSMTDLVQMSGKTKVAILGLGTAWILTFSKFKTISNISLAIATFGKNIAALSMNFGVLTTLRLMFLNLAASIKATTLALLKNPMTWFVAGLALATIAIGKHIAKQRELKRETEELRQSYKSLHDEMKKGSLGTSPEHDTEVNKIKQKQKALQDLINKRKELENSIKNASSENLLPQDKSAKLSMLTGELNKVRGNIEDTIKVLKDAGFTIDENTGKIYDLAQAEQQANINKDIAKIREESQARIDNINTILDEIDEYVRLSQQENLNSEEKIRLTQLSHSLSGSIQGLILTVDEHGNAVIQNSELLGINREQLIKEKGEIFSNSEQGRLNAINRIEQENAKTKAVKEQVDQRIAQYQREIAALQQTIEAKSQAGFFERAWYSLSGKKGSDQEKLGELKKGLQDAQNQSKAFSETLNNNYKSVSNLKSNAIHLSDSRVSASSSASGGRNEPTSSSYGGGDGREYYPSEKQKQKKGKTGKSSADKAKSEAEKRKREQEKAERDRLEKLKKELDNKLKQYENAIKELDKNISLAEDQKELYKDNPNKVVDIDKKIEQYTKGKYDKLKQQEGFIKQEINSGKYNSDMLQELKDKLVSVQTNASKVYVELKKIKMELIDEEYERRTKSLIKNIEELKFKMDAIDSKDTYNKTKLKYMDDLINKQSNLYKTSQQYTNSLRTQLNTERDLAKRSALQESYDKYLKTTRDLNIQLIQTMTAKKNLIKDLTFETEHINKYTRRIEELSKALKQLDYEMAKLDIRIQTNISKDNYVEAYKSYEEYVNKMKIKMVELNNQNKQLNSSMKKLQDEFKLNFKVDISKMDETGLNRLYDDLFKTQRVNSKEEKEKLEEKRELFKELKESYEQLLETTRNNETEQLNINKEIIDKVKEQKNMVMDLTKDMQDRVKEVLRKQLDEEKKSYDDRLKALKEFVDNKKKELNREWEEDDYQKELDKKLNEKQKLLDQINAKSRDTSLTGQKIVEDLKQQLKELDEQIANYQKEHDRKKIEQSLDDKMQEAEKDVESKKEQLDKTFNEEKLNMMSYEALVNGFLIGVDGKMLNLKDTMIDFLKETSDGLSVIGKKLQDEMIVKLEQANQILKTHKDLMPQLQPSLDLNKFVYDPNLKYQLNPQSIRNSNIKTNTSQSNVQIMYDALIKNEGTIFDQSDLLNLMKNGSKEFFNEMKRTLNKQGIKI